jgi:hypothetical protein
MKSRRAVLAIGARASQGVGLFAVAWLATHRLTPAELGFFFSFLSFGALIQLADFGLSYAALQTGGSLAGTARLNELRAVAKQIATWNFYAAGFATVVVSWIGWSTFMAGGGQAVSGWRAPWVGYLLGTFVFQLSMPAIALREGAGRVVEMWKLRLFQEWVGSIACLLVLHFGGRLWCLAAYAAARATVAGCWLLLRTGLPRDRSIAKYTMQRWLSEVWPFQWKIGMSVLSGFLIFRAIPPIILVEKGPVMAGQFGLAISVMNLLISVTSAWPMSHAAHYSTLIARRQFGALRREFPSLLWASTALAVVTALFSIGVLWWTRQRGFTFSLRMTDPATTAIILSAAVVHHIVLCIAMFLRAEGREPLLIPSVIGGVVTVSAVWLTAHFGTARDIAIVNLVLAVGGIPIAFLLLRGRQRFWSRSNSDAEMVTR